MHFSQFPTSTAPIRTLATANFDELAKFQSNKNRHYTQLAPGKLDARFMDVSLINVQVFKEIINVGSRIEAAPAHTIVPFAYTLSAAANFSFCGQKGTSNRFIQASGGSWDINFKDELAYIGCAFDREYFDAGYQLLTDKETPKQYFICQINTSRGHLEQRYAVELSNILNWLLRNPVIYLYPETINLLCSQILKLTINTLPQIDLNTKVSLTKHPKRVRAAKCVIEYLQEHARELPDMQTLCEIGKVSERSLQYGFLDYIGITPIQYLRVIRLNGVNADLLSACENTTNVTRTALKWGFIELGRFSREYKKLFQELPSATLRR